MDTMHSILKAEAAQLWAMAVPLLLREGMPERYAIAVDVALNGSMLQEWQVRQLAFWVRQGCYDHICRRADEWGLT